MGCPNPLTDVMPCCSWWTYKHFLYIGMFALHCGAILSVLSLVMPYWRTGGGVDEGLYYYVQGGDTHNLDDIVYGDTGWWRFCQVFYPFLVLSAVLAAVCGTLFTFKLINAGEADRKLALGCLAFGVFAGALVWAVFLAYQFGVYRKDKGQELNFCFRAIHATSPLLIIGGSWTWESHKCYVKHCIN